VVYSQKCLQAFLMLVFFAVHIALHWRWIVFTTKNFFGRERETKVGEVIEANYMLWIKVGKKRGNQSYRVNR
jgi:hypothetical protein